jgi:transcriptional regulator with XRE-family HTH domain
MIKKEVQKAFGNSLKKYRLLSNKSQEELAFSESMSPAYIGALERGEKCPSLDTIYKLSRSLGVSPLQLLDFDNDVYTDTEAYIIVMNVLNNVPDNNRLKLARIFEKFAELYKEDIK